MWADILGVSLGLADMNVALGRLEVHLGHERVTDPGDQEERARSEQDFRADARRAENVPAYQNVFRQLSLNQWVQQSSRWLDM